METTFPSTDSTPENSTNVALSPSPDFMGLKLSDAIRQGATIVPNQEFGGWGDGVETGCALTVAKKYLTKVGYTQDTLS